MDKEYIQICPKCKSDNITSNMTAASLGMGTFQNEFRCLNCGHEGMFFPEIKASKKKK